MRAERVLPVLGLLISVSLSGYLIVLPNPGVWHKPAGQLASGPGPGRVAWETRTSRS